LVTGYYLYAVDSVFDQEVDYCTPETLPTGTSAEYSRNCHVGNTVSGALKFGKAAVMLFAVFQPQGYSRCAK
jgi:hypothetical protein